MRAGLVHARAALWNQNKNTVVCEKHVQSHARGLKETAKLKEVTTLCFHRGPLKDFLLSVVQLLGSGSTGNSDEVPSS